MAESGLIDATGGGNTVNTIDPETDGSLTLCAVKRYVPAALPAVTTAACALQQVEPSASTVPPPAAKYQVMAVFPW